MRNHVKNYIEELSKQDLSLEYECVNALQKTPWRINEFVLETIRAAWDGGEEWVGLPAKESLPLPNYPFSKDPKYLDDDQQDEFKKFKATRNTIYNANARNMSKRIQVERTLQLAEEYLNIPEFYYVWQCDFRGRKYPVESFLSPQNAEYTKALLEFSSQTTIIHDGDAQWQDRHGDNVFGVDKGSREDREMWEYRKV